jgi:hypothetical protein
MPTTEANKIPYPANAGVFRKARVNAGFLSVLFRRVLLTAVKKAGTKAGINGLCLF